MKDAEKLENKGGKTAKAKKGTAPELVKVRVKPFRGVGGIGGPGTVKEIPAELAESLSKDGFVDILKEDE